MSNDKSMKPLTAAEREALRKAPKGPNRIPPKPTGKLSGKDRYEAKKKAIDLCEKVCQGSEWMILGFKPGEKAGTVEINWKILNFPNEAFEEAASLVAQLFTKILAETGYIAPVQSATMPQQVAELLTPNPAQKSESTTDAEMNALPTSLAGAGSEPKTEPPIDTTTIGFGEALDDGRQATGRALPGEGTPRGEDPQDYTMG